jgi:hypothetical protein
MSLASRLPAFAWALAVLSGAWGAAGATVLDAVLREILRRRLDLPDGHSFLFKRSGGKNLTVGEVEDRLARVQEMGALRREVLV